MSFKFLLAFYFIFFIATCQNVHLNKEQIVDYTNTDSLKLDVASRKEKFYKNKILKAAEKSFQANEKRKQKNFSLNPQLRTIEFTDYDKLNYIEYLKDIKSSILENLTNIVERELKNDELNHKEKRELMFKMQQISNFNIKEKSKDQAEILYNIEYNFDHLIELKDEEYSLDRLTNIAEHLIVMRDQIRLDNELLGYRKLLVDEQPKNERSDFLQEKARSKFETLENKKRSILLAKTKSQNKKNNIHHQMVLNQQTLREKVREAKVKKELLFNEKLNKNHHDITSHTLFKAKPIEIETDEKKIPKLQNSLKKDIDLAYKTISEDDDENANATVKELQARISELEKKRDNIIIQHELIKFRESSRADISSRAMR